MRYVSRLAVLCLCAAVPGVFGQTLSITNYQLVSSQKITTSLAYVTYKADIINKGNPIGAVLATASTLDPASFTVAAGEDTLKFAQVPANTPVTSSNTFTIRVDRTIPFDVANITWTFQTTPLPPVSNPGPNQTVKVGQTVTLNGSGSTNPSGVGTLAYNWAFMLRPGGAAQLNSPTAMMPTFTIDMPGNYVVASDRQQRSCIQHLQRDGQHSEFSTGGQCRSESDHGCGRDRLPRWQSLQRHRWKRPHLSVELCEPPHGKSRYAHRRATRFRRAS